MLSLLFYTHWISRFGAPVTITTDRGSQFESQVFTALTNLIGSKRIRTTAYHPAANGMEERWHRSLKASIMCHDNNEWVDVLPTVLLGLRTSFKEDLKGTVAEMVYGTTLRLPGEFFTDVDMLPDSQPFLEKFRQHMQLIRSIPAAHHHRKPLLFTKICSLVFLRVDAVKKPLQPPYEGPYEVLERISDVVFKIKIQGEAVTVSTERLKPAFIERCSVQELQEQSQNGSGRS